MVELEERNTQLPEGNWLDGENTPAALLVPVCLTIPILFLERHHLVESVRNLIESLPIGK